MFLKSGWELTFRVLGWWWCDGCRRGDNDDDCVKWLGGIFTRKFTSFEFRNDCVHNVRCTAVDQVVQQDDNNMLNMYTNTVTHMDTHKVYDITLCNVANWLVPFRLHLLCRECDFKSSHFPYICISFRLGRSFAGISILILRPLLLIHSTIVITFLWPW